jgi:hypothetical protein
MSYDHSRPFASLQCFTGPYGPTLPHHSDCDQDHSPLACPPASPPAPAPASSSPQPPIEWSEAAGDIGLTAGDMRVEVLTELLGDVDAESGMAVAALRPNVGFIFQVG